eukprot:1159212-Pelagomonas_calceolata.AAC.4
MTRKNGCCGRCSLHAQSAAGVCIPVPEFQVVMSQLEQRSLDNYHQWQLNEHRRQLVDVQVGASEVQLPCSLWQAHLQGKMIAKKCVSSAM